MKTYELNRDQMNNPVVLELFNRKRAKWNKNDWNGKEFQSGTAKMNDSEVKRFNEICDENHLESLRISK